MSTQPPLEHTRPARWMRLSRKGAAGRLSNRLLVFVPMTPEEMALTLSVAVEEARALYSSQPMYFLIRPRRWLSPN